MRSLTYLSSAFLVLLAGCATFKELEPKPELSPLERGYIELRNDAENFKLSQGKHYFIKFPSPMRNRFALVQQISAKSVLSSYLTRYFDDGKGPITRIPDEAAAHDSLSVYAIDTAATVFYWVIDTVRHDVELSMRYRYVPRWRYTFETKYAEFKETLAGNLVNRATYTSAAGAPAIDAVDFSQELSAISGRTLALSTLNDQLAGVAGLFPPDIAAGRDTAYQNYKALRASVEEELQFQRNYSAALGIFQKEKSTWGNTGAFLAEASTFADFLEQQSRFPGPIVEKARKAFHGRLTDVVPYYEKQLQRKRDVKPFTPVPPLETVARLLVATDRKVPADFDALRAYVKRFNIEAEGVQAAGQRLKELYALLDRTSTPPPPSFYANITTAARDIKAGLPQALAAADERYRSLEAGALVALELGKAGEQADDLQALFGTGEQVAQNIAGREWASAEIKTRELHEGKGGQAFSSVSRHRDKLVRWFEADIFNGVYKATQERLDAFVKLHEATFLDVPRLYADSAFTPVYALTFSTAGPSDLSQKRAQIDGYIAKIRNYQFPEAAIRAIYKDFSRDLNAQGVDRARAIVEHGKTYKGNDKQLTGIVSECDPTVAKWIVRPKEYRRVLALPITSNRKGVNEYVVRIKLQIPSEAQFPVFDVNVKLPKEIAEGAGREAWYDQITINQNPIKNEGRFRITSPTAENNYESQITPVQMDKDGVNILDIRFKKATFKVYEISAMAQVPIMKKN